MRYSENGMCAILLASAVGLKGVSAPKPLDMKEWADFLGRVIARGAEPKIVFGAPAEWGPQLGYSQDQIQRLQMLLGRGGAVALELDDFSRKGIDAVTMFDPDYPALLKRRLKRRSPPVLLYSGSIALCNRPGIGVVGSRNVDGDGAAFAAAVGEKAAMEGAAVFSGGARGVDTIAADSAIQNGGTAVVYIADALQTRIKQLDVLRAIMDGQLLLLSDTRPEEGFSMARAMRRNAYIYTSAAGTIVVSSDLGKGGTWGGVTEALQHRWGKVLVWDHSAYRGNQALLERGGVPYVLSAETLYEAATKQEAAPAWEAEYQQMDLFQRPEEGQE